MPAPTNANEAHCTFTLASDVTAGGLPSEEEIARDLEKTDDPRVQRLALKGAIMAMLGGEAMPRILMQVIRFCINTKDKQLQRRGNVSRPRLAHGTTRAFPTDLIRT